MTSDPRSAFVCTWLPGATEPVVAGRLDAASPVLTLRTGWIADAALDAWGRRVILNRRAGGAAVDTADLARR